MMPRYVPLGKPDILDRPRLAPREKQVLALIMSGSENHQIAQAMKISKRTVANYIHNLFARTGATTRTELIQICQELDAKKEASE